MSIMALGPDKYYKIEHSPVSHKVRFCRQWVGPQTYIEIAEADYTYTNANSIFVDTAAGNDSTGDGTTETPYATLTKGANSCTATITKVLVKNTALISENLDAIDNAYFEGFYAATGETPTYTHRELGFTPADANSIFVDKTGNDTTGDGSQATPVLTIAKAITLCDGTHQAVVIMDSGTYDEAPFEFTGDFLGLYAALGEAPTVTMDAASATYTTSTTNFNEAATTYIDSCVLTNGNIVIVWTHSDGTGYFKIISSAGAEVKAAAQFDGSACTYNKVCPNGDGFVIAYADATVGKFQRYAAAGTTEGSLTTFESGATKYIAMCELSGGGFAIAYQDDDDSDKGKFVIRGSDGSSVKAVTEFEAGATIDVSICEIATTDIIIAFADAGADPLKPAYTTKFRRFTYDGTAQDGGTPVDVDDTAGYGTTFLSPFSNGNFVVLFGRIVSSNLKFRIYDSGGVAATEVQSVGSYLGYDVITLSNNDFILFFTDTGEGTFLRYNSSGIKQGETVTFEYGSTRYISASVQSDDSFVICYQDDGDSDYGKFIFNTDIYWKGLTISTAATINGITFDGENQDYLGHLMSSASSDLTLRWCEVKNVLDDIFADARASIRTASGDVDMQYCSIRDNRTGAAFDGNTVTAKYNLFYRNSLDFGLITRGTAASEGDIDIQHNTFFDNYGGLEMENNGGTNETVKNNIFSENSVYDIDAETAMTTTYSIISESKCANVTAGTGCTAANPLFRNTGDDDEDDTDLMLKLRVMADYADSPAYQLSDDSSPDRDAGAWDVIVIGEATTWSSFLCEKPDTGIQRIIDFVGATEIIKKSGDLETDFSGMLEGFLIAHEGVRDAEALNWLTALSSGTNLIRFYPNPTTDAATYQLFKLRYKSFHYHAKAWVVDDEYKQKLDVQFARKFELA